MTRLLESLSPAVRYWLSSLARLAEEMDWPARLARSKGWRSPPARGPYQGSGPEQAYW
jgi:hypothetical protein